MSKATDIRDKVVNVLTSVLTVAAIVSQVGAEVVEIIGGWDGEVINLVAVIPALIFAIRRVTSVPKEERGLS